MIGWIFAAITAAAVLILALMFGLPVYNVWQQKLAGEAELIHATQTKQIQVQQAQAEVESAKLRSVAIREVGQASKDFPQYREQEFIREFGEALKNGAIQKIIYVPTEANIPIIEARQKD